MFRALSTAFWNCRERDMADPDIDDMREIAASLAASTRELNDAASRIAEAMPAQANSSNITIQAGGITNAIAVCVAGSTVVLFLLFATWTMWQLTEAKAQQEAWIQVWQQRISQEGKNADG